VLIDIHEGNDRPEEIQGPASPNGNDKTPVDNDQLKKVQDLTLLISLDKNP